MRLRSIALGIAVLGLVGCEAGLPTGSVCAMASDCAVGLVCRLGRCRVECAEQRDCPLGTLCLFDAADRGSCALPDDPGCSASRPCTDGLSCFDGACVNACDTVVDCPAGSACVAADGRFRCVRDDTTDAGTRDGGETDASELDAATPCVGPGCQHVAEVVAGDEVTCARTTAMEVWCWGSDSYGELGDAATHGPCPEETECSPVPVRAEVAGTVEGGPLVALSLSIAGANAAAVSWDGLVVSWGAEYTSLLGRTGDPRVARPVEREGGGFVTGIDHVRAGGTFFLARGVDDAGWGFGGLGQLGGSADHTLAVDLDPAAMGVADVSIALGRAHGCGLGGGDVTCWGANEHGQCGLGAPIGTGAFVGPTAVSLPGAATRLAVGAYHSCALVGDDVWCWGSGTASGRSDAPSSCPAGAFDRACEPRAVYRAPGVVYTALWSGPSAATTCALDDAGRAWCWGDLFAATPAIVPDFPPTPTSVSVGRTHVCVVSGDDVWCAGENGSGQLGRAPAESGVHGWARVAWP